MHGLGLKNLDPAAAKIILGQVLPALPIRLGRVCVINPPWFLGRVVLPIIFTFLSPKLKSRFRIIHSNKVEKVEKFVPISSIPEEIGGHGEAVSHLLPFLEVVDGLFQRRGRG